MLTTALWQVNKDMEASDFDNWFENLKPERCNGVEKHNRHVRLSEYMYFNEMLNDDHLHIVMEILVTGEFEELFTVTFFIVPHILLPLTPLVVPMLHHVN